MDEDTRRYLVEILLRARDEISGVAQKATESLNKVTGAQESATQAQAVAAKSSRDQVTELQRLHEAHIREKRDLDSMAAARRTEAAATRDQTTSLRKQLDETRKLQAENIKSARDLQNLADARERTVGKIDKETKALNRQAAAYARSADQNRLLGDKIFRSITGLERQASAFEKDALNADKASAASSRLIGQIDKQVVALKKQEEAFSGLAQKRKDLANAEKAELDSIAKARYSTNQKAVQAEQDKLKAIEDFNALARKAEMRGLEQAAAQAERYGELGEANRKRREAEKLKDQDARLKASQKASDDILAESIKQTVAETKALESESQALRKTSAAQIEHQKAIQNTLDTYDEFIKDLRSGNVETDVARSQLKRFAGDFDKLGRSYETGSDGARVFSRASEDARRELAGFGREMETQSGGGGSGNRFNRFLADISGNSDRSSYNIAKLGLALQGLQVAFAVKYAQALLTTLVGLAGTLFTVASAALQAGAALAAGLAAGAAQAIPVVGLLLGSLFGVAEVLKAISLANQQKLLGDRTASQQAGAIASANERIHDSESAVANARRDVADAEQGVITARAAAIRQIEDLVAAERRAKQAADDAGLSLETAQVRLRQLLSTGGTAAEIAQAQSDVTNARFDLGDAKRARGRSAVDAAGARKGPDKQANVVSASRALTDARRRETEATRNLAVARGAAADALVAETAGVDRLQAMLASFSPAQRRIYTTLTDFLGNLRATFIGTNKKDGLLGPLIDSIRTGIERADSVLKSKSLLTSFRVLVAGMSREAKKLVDFGASDSNQSFFRRLTFEANRNLPLVGSIVQKVFGTIRNVVKAALPAFRDLLELIDKYATRAQNASSGSSGLTKFFKDGVELLDSFVELGLAAIDVISSLMDAGASEEGKKGIDGLTEALKKAATWIDNNRSSVRKFYSDARDITERVGKMFVVLGKAVIKLFDPANSRAFVDFLTKVLIPAVGNVISVMGTLTEIVHNFLSLPLVSDFAQWIVSIALLTRGFGILRQAVDVLTTSLGLARDKGGKLFLANPWLAAITAITTALLILDSKFGIFGKFADLFKSASDKAKEAADKVTDAITRQIDAMRRQRDAELARQGSRIALGRAEVAVERAQAEAKKVGGIDDEGKIRKGVKVTDERRDASLNLKQALLDEKSARRDLSDAKKKDEESDQQAVTKSKDTVEAIQVRVDALEKERDGLSTRKDEVIAAIKVDEKFLRDNPGAKGTDHYKEAANRLIIAKKELREIDGKLKDNQDNLTDSAKKGVSAFNRWKTAVGRAGSNTETFGDTVSRTMESIVGDVNQVLGEFGAKKIKFNSHRKKTPVEKLDGASEIFDTPDIGGFPGRQFGGGAYRVPGTGSGDKVRMQALVEPGENVYVLNRNASAHLDQLKQINSAIPRFAKGGIVPIPGMPGESIDSRILPDVLSLIRRYKLHISDGYAPTGHKAAGEHPLGLAIDAGPGVGGSWDLVDKLAKWAEPTQNQPRPPFRWVGYDGDAGHGRGNHIHLSWLHDGLKSVQTLGGKLGSASSSIARRAITGPGGALHDILGGSADRAVKAANRYVDRKLAELGPSSTGLEDDSSVTVGSGSDRARSVFDYFVGHRLSQAQAAGITGVFGKESGYSTTIRNARSGATGLAQWLGDRLTRLQSKKGWQGLQTQLDYVWEELTGSERTALNGLRQTKTPGDAAISFDRLYERSDAILDAVSRAQQAYDLFGGDKAKGGKFQKGGLIPFAGAFGTGGSFIANGPTAYVAGDMGRERVTVERLQKGGSVTSESVGVSAVIGALDGAVGKVSRFRIAMETIFGNGGLMDQMTQKITDLGTAAKTAIQQSQFGDGTRRRLLGVAGTIKAAGGSLGLGREALQGAESVRREGVSLRGERQVIFDQQTSNALAAMSTRTALSIARSKKDKKGIQQAEAQLKVINAKGEELSAALADNSQSLVENIESFQQELFNAVNDAANNSNAALDRSQRVATALGRPLNKASSSQANIDIMTRQIQGLQDVAKKAGGTGNTALRKQALDQIAELYTVIQEVQAQAFQDSIDTVNDTAGKALKNNDRTAAYAQIGDTDYGMLGNSLKNKSGILTTQIGGLQALRDQAIASGNLTQIDSLTDQIDDLNLELAQNTQAIQDNTDAAFDATTQSINDRAGFQTSFLGGVGAFFKGLSTLTGQDTTAQQAGVLATTGNTLGTQRSGLLGQLSSLLGPGYENIGNLQGADLINFLQTISTGPAFDAIMARLDPTQQQAFKDLVLGLVTNTSAIQDNTSQLQELNGSNAQGFSSTSWTMFRRAIFTGAGNLLPRYQMTVPQAAAGAKVLSDGLVQVHSNEIIPARLAPYEERSGDTNIDVHVTSPVEVLDPVDAARQFGFAYRQARSGRSRSS